MKIDCQACGCIYKVNTDDEEDKEECGVTAELIECPMCFGEEEVESEEDEEESICINELSDTVKNSKTTDKIPSPYPKRRIILSKKADEIIEKNYKENIDRELVKIIKEKLSEEYTYEQVKARRKHLGLFKNGNVIAAHKARKKYRDEHFDFFRNNINKVENNEELRKNFNLKFNMNISLSAMNQQMSTHGIHKKKITKELKTEDEEEIVELIDPKQKSVDEKEKRKRKGMSEESVAIIEENYMEKTDDDLRELIADETGNFFNTDRIENYRLSNGMERPDGWQSPEESEIESEDDN